MAIAYRIIDSFNLLHHLKRSQIKDIFHDIATMIAAIETYAVNRGEVCQFVFDGIRFEDQYESTHTSQMHFSEPGQTGDELMERLMNLMPEESRRFSTLVTDDRCLTDMALGMGVRHERCEIFMRSMTHKSYLKDDDDKPNYANKPFNNPFNDLG
ncbi:MAG: putative RNA-binding protein with PIN domain [Candidatus Omnitrophota bacterium]|jgi:predicted RNA-binding protein with PIN domain